MSDKNISRIKEYAKEQSIEDTIGMILSNRVDYGGEQGGMVSVKQFDQVAKDLIEIFPQIKAIQVQAKVKPANNLAQKHRAVIHRGRNNRKRKTN